MPWSRRRSLVLCSLFASLFIASSACKKETPPTPTPVAQAPDGAPASVPAVLGLLSARHADDLPSKKTLDHHKDAHAALLWIAKNGDRAIHKNRATLLLGLYPEQVELHQALLDEYAAVTAPHATIRAAALNAWAKHDKADRASRIALFQAAIADPDPRVKQAGHAAMVGLKPKGDLP